MTSQYVNTVGACICFGNMAAYLCEPYWTITGLIIDNFDMIAIVLTAVVVDMNRDKVDCAVCAKVEEIQQPLN